MKVSTRWQHFGSVRLLFWRLCPTAASLCVFFFFLEKYAFIGLFVYNCALDSSAIAYAAQAGN